MFIEKNIQYINAIVKSSLKIHIRTTVNRSLKGYLLRLSCLLGYSPSHLCLTSSISYALVIGHWAFFAPAKLRSFFTDHWEGIFLKGPRHGQLLVTSDELLIALGRADRAMPSATTEGAEYKSLFEPPFTPPSALYKGVCSDSGERQCLMHAAGMTWF